MIPSTTSSALNLFHSAKLKAADAAHAIATLPVADEAGTTGFGSNELLPPVIDLMEAKIETSAAVKILQSEDERIGSLFDALS